MAWTVRALYLRRGLEPRRHELRTNLHIIILGLHTCLLFFPSAEPDGVGQAYSFGRPGYGRMTVFSEAGGALRKQGKGRAVVVHAYYFSAYLD